ncbi:hypothetical protein IDM40_09910 [Nocardiopsis sp. HNM0947]|uniref:ABM domain-containing protein n=1 Tax=Nocardiopsis coralli TaxID=2772213 RepID=A0ABR9P5C3_9ACTN|nr:hypothetical protein [Nocardiopsis coralli]MBE2999011.1 hypothetical protein [Nocardiopsis coralli]
MSESQHGTALLLHNTMRVTDGHLEAYREAIEAAVDFTRAHAPQLMVEIFLDEENMRAHSFQLYADSDAVLRHWDLSDPYIRAVNEHCEVLSLEVYGDPDDRVRAGLPAPGSGVPITFLPRLAGFVRGGS